MIQYKLIQEYPGSPKLETIHWFQTDEFGPSSNNIWQGTNFYDSHPQFWQKVEEYSTVGGLFGSFVPMFNLCMSIKKQDKVEEVNFEVLSFSNGNSINKNLGDFYLMQSDFECNKKTNVFIHSVKRLSDGEVFTIGDKCKYIDEIATFRLKEDKILVVGEKATDFLNHIKRDKTPLFTTEDGVEIFEGEEYHYVAKGFYYGSQICSKDHKELTNSSETVRFSTRKKAEEYILLNKPCLSLNDLFKNFYPEEYDFKNRKNNGAIEDLHTNDLIELAKSKL